MTNLDMTFGLVATNIIVTMTGTEIIPVEDRSPE